MGREFDRNMFIMLLAVMVGVSIITFFAADLIARTDEGEKHKIEIESIEQQNTNFTTRLLSSLGYLDRARESRSEGNYHYDLAYLWYSSALVLTDNETLNAYKNSTFDNCSLAIESFTLGFSNFGVAQDQFEVTLTYSQDFSNLVNLYIDLAKSAGNLCQLRINASTCILYLAENLTLIDGSAGFSGNVSDLNDLLNQTIEDYNNELINNYGKISNSIEKEYNIVGFSEIREEY